VTTNADAEAECARVHATYPPARARELLVFTIAIGILCVASVFLEVDWAFALGGVVGFAAWELTKLRLRRNARDLAQRSR
jgi:hypothetical protein